MSCVHITTNDLCIFAILSKTGFVDIVPLCCKPSKYFRAVFFSQRRQIHVLSSGVHRFCKKNSGFSQLTASLTDRQTDRRTDGKAISIAERLLYVTLANNEKLTDTYNKRTLDYAGLFLPYHAEGVRV